MSTVNRLLVVLLIGVVVLMEFVHCAPSIEGAKVAEMAGVAEGLESAPALVVRSARACTNAACAQICAWLGWPSGVCLDADNCLCYS